MPIVFTGHVDHGKSTLIGQLLFSTGSLMDERCDDIHQSSILLGKETEYAFAMDSLEEERTGGLTIDTTQVQFLTEKRKYTIVDAPGHKEFLKNMITGSSYASAAVLVIDAEEGIQEQTKRHAYILNMVGIKNIIVAINKMDLVSYSDTVYKTVKNLLESYLSHISLKPRYCIPISAKLGKNIISNDSSMAWYDGPCLREALDELEYVNDVQKPFRFPVQDVYERGQESIIVGRIESGEVYTGMVVHLLPHMKECRVKKIKKFTLDYVERASYGDTPGLVIENGCLPKRGEVLSGDTTAMVTKKFDAHIFWFEGVYDENETISIKHTTQDTRALMKVHTKFDPALLDTIINKPSCIEVGEVAHATIETNEYIVIDPFPMIPEMGRFVIEKNGIPVGGGIVV